MNVKMLLGTLIGYTVAFLLFSIWDEKLNWTLWIAIMFGGTIGHIIMVNIDKRKKK